MSQPILSQPILSHPILAGRRILVVEDEALVAMLIEDTLADHGGCVVGPFARVDAALAAATTEALDAAVLDANVSGEKIYPVADALDARGIPFLLLSGYGLNAVPADRPHWRALAKPFSPDQVARVLAELVAGADRVAR